MKKIITADDLKEIKNQQEAGNTLRNLLKGVSPGDAEIHTEATLVMAKTCPSLAMTIRQSIDNWNKCRYSIISAQPEPQHGKQFSRLPINQDPPMCGPFFLRTLAKKQSLNILNLNSSTNPQKMVSQLGTSTYTSIQTIS